MPPQTPEPCVEPADVEVDVERDEQWRKLVAGFKNTVEKLKELNVREVRPVKGTTAPRVKTACNEPIVKDEEQPAHRVRDAAACSTTTQAEVPRVQQVDAEMQRRVDDFKNAVKKLDESMPPPTESSRLQRQLRVHDFFKEVARKCRERTVEFETLEARQKHFIDCFEDMVNKFCSEQIIIEDERARRVKEIAAPSAIPQPEEICDGRVVEEERILRVKKAEAAVPSMTPQPKKLSDEQVIEEGIHRVQGETTVSSKTPQPKKPSCEERVAEVERVHRANEVTLACPMPLRSRKTCDQQIVEEKRIHRVKKGTVACPMTLRPKKTCGQQIVEEERVHRMKDVTLARPTTLETKTTDYDERQLRLLNFFNDVTKKCREENVGFETPQEREERYTVYFKELINKYCDEQIFEDVQVHRVKKSAVSSSTPRTKKLCEKQIVEEVRFHRAKDTAMPSTIPQTKLYDERIVELNAQHSKWQQRLKFLVDQEIETCMEEQKALEAARKARITEIYQAKLKAHEKARQQQRDRRIAAILAREEAQLAQAAELMFQAELQRRYGHPKELRQLQDAFRAAKEQAERDPTERPAPVSLRTINFLQDLKEILHKMKERDAAKRAHAIAKGTPAPGSTIVGEPPTRDVSSKRCAPLLKDRKRAQTLP